MGRISAHAVEVTLAQDPAAVGDHQAIGARLVQELVERQRPSSAAIDPKGSEVVRLGWKLGDVRQFASVT